MNRIGLTLGLAFTVALLFMAIDVTAQMGHGGGSGMMGHGMMGGGMAHGMMHQAPGPGWRNPQPGAPYGNPYENPNGPPSQRGRALDEKEARAILEDYLKSTRNPNLKLGKIEDEGEAYKGEILTKDDSLVDKVIVDKRTGSMRSVY